MDTITVTSCNGDTFKVNTSDKACGKFKTANGVPLKHGDRIQIEFPGRHFKKKGTVMGVAPFPGLNKTLKTLWFALDFDNGKVSYAEPWDDGDLSLIEETG